VQKKDDLAFPRCLNHTRWNRPFEFFRKEVRYMSETKVFQLNGTNAVELARKTIELEKSLQTIMEKNLETFLGVGFLESEYTTGKTHGGRIDTLGLDENGCPVIIEYKRAINENVINQGLFYLDWLLDHKGEFKLLVLEKMGKQKAEQIDWTGPRLICVAASYTKYDEHAVKQINRNIDLIKYCQFGADLIALELVYSNSTNIPIHSKAIDQVEGIKKGGDKSLAQWLEEIDPEMLNLFESLQAFLLALGDDVSEKQLKLYMTYRRIKNFACVVIQRKTLLVYLKLNPDTVELESGFSRDMREIGHWGTGDLEITLRSHEDLHKAEALLVRSYEEA
jgi:predicted transport protein